MRRKDKEIKDSQLIEKILDEADVIRIAMVDDGDPYLVAMNFAYADNLIYMHSAKAGRKIDILKKNCNVAFQADIGAEVVPGEGACNCGTRYMSVFGTGRAVLIDEEQEKKNALDAIMRKYTGKDRFDYIEKVLQKTLIIKIEISSMTGKESES